MAVQPGLCQTWSETPKTGFLLTQPTLLQDKLKVLKQERDTLLADEERFISYLNDLEIHKRQQDQQMIEVAEAYNNQGRSGPESLNSAI